MALLQPHPQPHAGIDAIVALERVRSVPCLHALAVAYAATAGRPRRRGAPAAIRYRYPRGRATDAIPVAAALRQPAP